MVSAALKAGYSMADIHASLVSQGFWSGHYATFRRYVGACRRNAPVGTRQPTAHAAVQQTATKPRTNPLLERRERPAYDYSQISEEAKRLIAPAGDDE